MAPITASTTPTTTIVPGPSPDQSTFQAVVSLAMISPPRMMATSPATIAEAFGPLGRAGALTLSWIGVPSGDDGVTGVFASIVLLLHHCELSDADTGIDLDLGRPVADCDCPGYVCTALSAVACIVRQENLAQAHVAHDFDGQVLRDQHLQLTHSDVCRDLGFAEALGGQPAEIQYAVADPQ